MGRIISFVGSGSSVGSTTLCFNCAKNISEREYKVCVFDFYFSMNNIVFLFKNDSNFDLKDFLIKKIGLTGILKKENENLYFIKSDNYLFDYLMYKD